MLGLISVALAQESAEEVLARFATEPTVRQVQLWAIAQVDCSPEQVQRWLAETRRAAWLPDVDVDLRLRQDWDLGYDYLDAGGLDPLPGGETFPVAQDAGQGWTREAKLGLSWRLGELVTSSERVRMVAEAQDLAELREEVAAEVTRTYFERRRLQVDLILAPKLDRAGQIRDQLRLEELTAALDGATGGAFSRGLAPPRDR
jgi:hypothetical protein